jgi:hypothetical protein
MPGREFTIPGIVTALPVGMTVTYANTWVLGRSKEFWPEVEEWKPARWIVADASDKEKATTTGKETLEDEGTLTNMEGEGTGK